MRTTYSQFHVLVEYMEKHGDISKYIPNPVGKANMLGQWEDLSRLVNGIATAGGTGPIRTPNQWRKVWSDFKNNSRKKAAKMRKSENSVDRGSLSKLESRVMAIINSNHVVDPTMHGSSEIVDFESPLDTGGREKYRRTLLNSDSEIEEAEEDDKSKVKTDYSIQNYTAKDYNYPSAHDDPSISTLRNEDNVRDGTKSLIEIKDQKNNSMSSTQENESDPSVGRIATENNEQKKCDEESNEAQHVASDWLQLQQNDKCNNLNSWINSIQYKRQKNSSASGWVDSDALRNNRVVLRQKYTGNMINNGQINYGLNLSHHKNDTKGARNATQMNELKNVSKLVVNVRDNSSSQNMKQLNYGVSHWISKDVEKNEGESISILNKAQNDTSAVEDIEVSSLVEKGKISYGLDILTSNNQLQNHDINTSKVTNSANGFFHAERNIISYYNEREGAEENIQRNSKLYNDASCSIQSNERSTEFIAEELDNHNSGQYYTNNAVKRRKSKQATGPVNKRIRVRESSSMFIDDDREQIKHERELELMRLEIQREDLKLKTRRLTLMEKIVTMAQEFL